MHVFLSHSFQPEDRELVGHVEALLSSHDVQIITGRRLGGNNLTPAVMGRIESADGCVALMTRRETVGAPEEGRWITHQWVRDELNHARDEQMRSVALVETGVEFGGAHGERERIPFDRDAPLEAFLALSETIRIWREELGRTRVARISPDDLGRRFRRVAGMTCQYRFVTPEGDRSDWIEAEPIPQPGGTLLYLKGVRSDQDRVEVEVLEGRQRRLFSEATPQYLSIALEELGG